MTESILNGETIVVVRIRKEEYELIKSLRANDTTLNDFIERKEEYIKTLEDYLSEDLFKLEEFKYEAEKSLKKYRKAYGDKPYTLDEIKKATHGSE